MAEHVLASGHADMVSMARPMLADAEFVLKASEGRSDEINTCIGCNQACLDHIFSMKIATCLVNPRACYETELIFKEAQVKKNIAVIGAGPAGLSFAVYAADRGHQVKILKQVIKLVVSLILQKQFLEKKSSTKLYATLVVKLNCDQTLNLY